MKYLFLTITCLMLFSCKQKNINQEETEKQEIVEKELTTEEIVKQYIPASNHLEFDEIIHYHNEKLDEGQQLAGDELPTATNDEKLFNEMGFSREITMSDSSKIKDLTRIGYEKHIVESRYFPTIKTLIHPEVDEYLSEETTCTHVYRDILVFKHQNKTVALIKWCFSCGDIVITRITGKNIDLEPYSGKLATILGDNYKSQTNKSLFKKQ